MITNWEGYNFHSDKFKWLEEDKNELPVDFLYPNPTEFGNQILPEFERLFLTFSLAQLIDPSGSTLKQEGFRIDAVKTWLIIDDAHVNKSGCKLSNCSFPINSYTSNEYDFAIRFLVSLRVFIHKLAKQRTELHPAGGHLSKATKRFIPFVFVCATGIENYRVIPNIYRRLDVLIELKLGVFPSYFNVLNKTGYKINLKNDPPLYDSGKDYIPCLYHSPEFLNAWLNDCEVGNGLCSKISKDNILVPLNLKPLLKFIKKNRNTQAYIEFISIMLSTSNLMDDPVSSECYKALKNSIIGPYFPSPTKSIASSSVNTWFGVKTSDNEKLEICDAIFNPYLQKDSNHLGMFHGLYILYSLVSVYYDRMLPKPAFIKELVKEVYGIEDHALKEKMKNLPYIPDRILNSKRALKKIKTREDKEDLQNIFLNIERDDLDSNAYTQFIKKKENYDSEVRIISALASAYILYQINYIENTNGINWDTTTSHIVVWLGNLTRIIHSTIGVMNFINGIHGISKVSQLGLGMASLT